MPAKTGCHVPGENPNGNIRHQRRICRSGDRYLAAHPCGVKLTGTPQNEAEATYSLWRDEEDYRIDWSTDADRIKRFIDSVGNPYKGASAYMGEHRVRVLDALVEPDIQIEARQPGKVVFMREGCPVVVCGRGPLRITDFLGAVPAAAEEATYALYLTQPASPTYNEASHGNILGNCTALRGSICRYASSI